MLWLTRRWLLLVWFCLFWVYLWCDDAILILFIHRVVIAGFVRVPSLLVLALEWPILGVLILILECVGGVKFLVEWSSYVFVHLPIECCLLVAAGLSSRSLNIRSWQTVRTESCSGEYGVSAYNNVNSEVIQSSSCELVNFPPLEMTNDHIIVWNWWRRIAALEISPA